jgi:hypothetical protein
VQRKRYLVDIAEGVADKKSKVTERNMLEYIPVVPRTYAGSTSTTKEKNGVMLHMSAAAACIIQLASGLCPSRS